MSETTLRRYPLYRNCAAELTHYIANDGVNRFGTIIQDDVEPREPFFKRFNDDLLENGSSVSKIAKVAINTECRLSDVVSLRNAEMTRGFLEEKLSLSEDNSDKRKLWINPYSLIDGDSRESVDKVMSALDLQNAEVILTYGPDRDLRRRHFFYNLVTIATEHPNLHLLKAFVQKIAKWNILDEEGSRLIEQEVFHKASKDVLKIFLQHRLDFHIKELFENDCLAALYGNPNVKIGVLKRKKNFHLSAAGFKGFTALHYAMMNKHYKKVKFLLDRGVEANSRTTYDSLPALSLALWKPTINPIDNEKCAELLLQYGANPFFTSNSFAMGFYLCIYARRALAKKKLPALKPTEYLTKLALAYACIYDDAGGKATLSEWSSRLYKVDHELEEDAYLSNYYRKCQRELQTLKKHEIRLNLTMYTIASKTGEHLIRLVNEEDQKIITSFIQKYTRDKTINLYYFNAIREHMRQYRKLVAHKNRAMFLISINVNVLAPYFVVLNKIVSYLSYKDLLMFQ